jgi:hypothetical protein
MERRLFLILLALASLMMVGCYQVKAYHNKQIDLVGDYRLETIEYQGCEYIVMQSHWKQHGTVIHKGNCRFCAERRQKELKELVIKLKEK